MRVLVGLLLLLPVRGLAAEVSEQTKQEAKIHFNRGDSYLQAAEYPKAIEEFLEAYRLFPNERLHYSIAQAYRLQGDKLKAIEHYQKYLAAVRQGETADDARLELAALLRETQQSAPAAPAQAASPPGQCTQDSECKEGRVCRNGECASPALVVCAKDIDCPGRSICSKGICVGPELPANGSPRLNEPDWSLAAGIIGLVSTVVVSALFIPGEVTVEGADLPGLALGGSGLLLTGVMAPVVFAGGASVRRSAGVPGVPALRIVGWISYGLAWAAGIVCVGLTTGPTAGIPHGPMITSGAFSVLSLTTFSADALVARSQARSLNPEKASRPSSRVTLLPSLAPVRLADGSYTGTFGLAGEF